VDIGAVLERTLQGLGYELVDFERQRGLLRVFIDQESGVNVDDCALVSSQLTRVFAVEGIDYERLEVSSPGLDRPLRKLSDFMRFQGQQAHIKVRVPRVNEETKGVQRNFTGQMSATEEGRIALTSDGAMHYFELHEIDKARLVPQLPQLPQSPKSNKSNKSPTGSRKQQSKRN
jgi:ribosome maturation factor RimP